MTLRRNSENALALQEISGLRRRNEAEEGAYCCQAGVASPRSVAPFALEVVEPSVEPTHKRGVELLERNVARSSVKAYRIRGFGWLSYVGMYHFPPARDACRTRLPSNAKERPRNYYRFLGFNV